MSEGSNFGVYAILAAVVVVGAAGLYFTMTESNGPTAYYNGIGQPSVSSPLSRPFSVIAKAKITGAIQAVGIKGITESTQTWAISCDPCTVVGTASILQSCLDTDTASIEWYTCGKPGNCVVAQFGDGTNIEDLTTIGTGTAAAVGGIGLQIHGGTCGLHAITTSILVNGQPAPIIVDYALFPWNDVNTIPICTPLCENCNLFDTCNTDLEVGGFAPDVMLCDETQQSMNTGGALCHSFKVENNLALVHVIANAAIIEVASTIECTNEQACV